MQEYIFNNKYMMLEAAAILYDFILLGFLLTQGRLISENGKRFRYLAITISMLTLVEILGPITRAWDAQFHVIKMYFDVSTFIFAFLAEVSFAEYMALTCKFKAPRVISIFNDVLIAFRLFVMLTSPFTGWISNYDEVEHVFVSGSLYLAVGYGPCIYFTIYSMTIFLINMKKTDFREKIFLIISFTLIVGASVMQPLMHGRLKLTGLFGSFAIFVLYLSLESSDYRNMVEVRRKLIEAKMTANAANLAKSTFLANTSHEIRTPMNAILGMNDIILRNNNEPQILKYSSDMKKAGGELLQIINDVLEISKIEAGQFSIKEEKYQLSKLVFNVESEMKGKAREKGLRLLVHVDDKLPDSLMGDVERIEQILIKLLDNAIKFTEKGDVELTITGKILNRKNVDEEEEGVNPHDTIRLNFVIEDTGVGIKEEDLPVIFDNFKRVDMERNRSIQGAGLGLSIVKNIVYLMGGRIDVQSYYNRGSRFSIDINQEVIGSDRYIDHVKVTGIRSNVEMPSLLGLRILVVDDNEMSLTVIKGLLRMTKAEIVLAESSAEGLKLLETEPFDLVFLDYMMPVMDGTEIFKRMVKDHSGVNHEVPFILMSANMTNEDMAAYSEQGFYYALSKPVDPNELCQLLETMC
jgi:signal transduction histidine kinase/CheY-like chemotaxis protein